MAWDGNNISITKDAPRNYMYGNTVFLLDEISDYTCAYLIGDLSNFVMNPQNAELQLNFIINSPGGDVYTMMTILGLMTIAKINKIKINTFVMGIAASAASVIAVQGDVRKITGVSRHFVHFGAMWSVTERHSEIEKIYQQTKDYAERIDKLYLQACPKLTPEVLRSLQLDERGYLTAEQCLEYGLCDSIVDQDLLLANTLEEKEEEFTELFEAYYAGDFSTIIAKLTKMNNQKNKKKK